MSDNQLDSRIRAGLFFGCKDCGAHKVLDPEPRGYSEKEKKRILQAYRESGSKRAISRIFGVSHNTLNRWLRSTLLEDGLRVSYSENGAKGNPWIESLWGRTKTEIGSRIAEASTLPDLRTVFDKWFRYYNRERRHSSIGYVPPREHLTQTPDILESEPQIAAAS